MNSTGEQEPEPNPAHLFLVRVWMETPPGGSGQWRGWVQHLQTGEAYEFPDWLSLIYHMNDRMAPSLPQVARPPTNDPGRQ